jgi:hypothetical protein
MDRPVMTTTTIRLPRELRVQLADVAARQYDRPSNLARRLLARGLAEEERRIRALGEETA